MKLDDDTLGDLRSGLSRLDEEVGRLDVKGRQIRVGDLLVVATDSYETQRRRKYLAIWHESLESFIARDLSEHDDLGWFLTEPDLRSSAFSTRSFLVGRVRGASPSLRSDPL